MSKRTRDIKAFHSVDDDLLTQYVELLELRAKVAGLLFRFKTSPRRRHNMRRNRLMIRALQRNERPTAAAPMLLVPPKPPKTDPIEKQELLHIADG